MVGLRDRAALRDLRRSATRTCADHRTVGDHGADAYHRTAGDHRTFDDGARSLDPGPDDPGDEPAEHVSSDDEASPAAHDGPTPTAHDDDQCPDIGRRVILSPGKTRKDRGTLPPANVRVQARSPANGCTRIAEVRS